MQRVLSLFRRRNSSPDYLRDQFKRDKKVFNEAKKQSDKTYAKMMKLFKRQPRYASDRYSYHMNDITEALSLIDRDLASNFGPERNMYPALTAEIRYYVRNMKKFVKLMEKTKNSLFIHLYRKITRSNL